jgi:hypothetical protein
MENVAIFYNHLEYFMAISHNVWQFGIVCGHWVYFSHFGMFGPRQIWQPWTLLEWKHALVNLTNYVAWSMASLSALDYLQNSLS